MPSRNTVPFTALANFTGILHSAAPFRAADFSSTVWAWLPLFLMPQSLGHPSPKSSQVCPLMYSIWNPQHSAVRTMSRLDTSSGNPCSSSRSWSAVNMIFSTMSLTCVGLGVTTVGRG